MLPVASQKVVPIDSGPWGHAAHPDAIILCRDDAGYRGAVVFISAIYVMAITNAGIVVVVEGGIDVWGKVLMGVVHPVINHGDVDPCAIDALHPYSFDIDVFSAPLLIAQVPLAAVERVVNLGVVQGGRRGFAGVNKSSVIGIFIGVDRVRNWVSSITAGNGHFDVVGARVEVHPRF